jgi:hypothetical protein
VLRSSRPTEISRGRFFGSLPKIVGRPDIERRRLDHGAIDRHAPGRNPAFRVPARAQAGTRHHLGDALALVAALRLGH